MGVGVWCGVGGGSMLRGLGGWGGDQLGLVPHILYIPCIKDGRNEKVAGDCRLAGRDQSRTLRLRFGRAGLRGIAIGIPARPSADA